MKIFVKAKAGAKEDKVVPPETKQESFLREPLDDARGKEEWWTVWTKEPPVQGRANDGVTRLLAKHFHVSPSSIRLVSGAASKRKVFEVRD